MIKPIHPWGPKVNEYVPGTETDIRETWRRLAKSSPDYWVTEEAPEKEEQQ